MNLETPLSGLPRIGKTTATKLKKLNLITVRDLLFYFPFRYEDYSQIKKIIDLRPAEAVTVRVKIQLIANRRARRRRLSVTEALVADDSGSLQVVWFNQPFIIKNLAVGDEVFLSGSLDTGRLQMVSPEYEKISAESALSAGGKILPVYHLTEGLTQKQLRFWLKQCATVIPSVAEPLPVALRERLNLPIVNRAVEKIHFPDTLIDADQSRHRFAFEELFYLQLAILSQKNELGENNAFPLAFLEKQTKDFVTSLPFTLTVAQKKCAWEILRDLAAKRPMNRLLEGDVGSGKTVVLAIALLNVILNGYKAMVMAPTEILAEQHYLSLQKLFKAQSFKIALLTGSRREVNGEKLTKTALLTKLNAGEVSLVIGTHAVIQDEVRLKDLGLVAVDEQHRFGVAQRKALLSRGQSDLTPHFLSMAATPIPRSLVLTLYGDLSLSVIDELPLGRKPIVTRLVFESERDRAYAFIRDQIKSGRQAFVICPLIDPSDTLGYKSVKQEYERLTKEIFPDLRLSLMHGRLKAKEKAQVMRDFAERKADLLVATSVIEVGIDVPNASLMLIEGADRFGLAQLHQFRGRVGRGEYQSYCLLFTDNVDTAVISRLRFMEKCRDGFALAEQDLRLRGPGEVFGTRQSGLPDLRVADLRDAKLIALAQAEAKNALAAGELSEEMRAALSKVKVSLHFE